ncbi:DUF5719 family protein [Gryllotalpicola reticulitermitis]|uniref:DUF5719 family protein n=1 Tax=Gryllotalpicola reticulitermitis TaxID=1184153 RepID=A0ABV8Q583_9MICO
MASRTAATRIGGRVLAGIVGLAASACVVGAVLTVSPAGAHTTAASRTVTPVPATAIAACPGPLLSLASGAQGSALSATGTPSVSSGGGTQSPGSSTLSAADITGGGTAPRAFQQPAPKSGGSPLLAAAQSSSARTAELSGFAATNCVQPDYDSWLVGGATSLGSTTLVVLSNPGDVAATVDLDVYDEQGLVQASGGQGVPVQPHSQHVVPLAGLAPNASATAIHVTSTGGTVTAHLQESHLTGITPQGVEWVAPTAPPASHLVIPGAVLDTTALSGGGASDSGDGGVAVLRVLPVGKTDAKLSIGVKPESGKKAGSALSVTVDHGVVSEVPLDRLASGTYTITVDSTAPIVGGVTTSTVSKQGTDFTWYDAAQPLTGATAIPLAAGAGKVVHLVNTSGSAVTVRFGGPTTWTAKIPAGGTVAKALSVNGVLSTTNAQGVYASVSYASSGMLASYVGYPTGAAASSLTVYGR